MITTESALYRNDRQVIDALLETSGEPSPTNITDAARLLSRYQDTTHLDLVTDLIKAMGNWGYSVTDTNAKAKEIWTSGWRPGGHSAVTVGSGADSEE